MRAAATVIACISFFAAAAILNIVVKKLSLPTHLAGGECWIIQKKQQETSSTMDRGERGNRVSHLGDCASQGAMAAIICQDTTRVNKQQNARDITTGFRLSYYNATWAAGLACVTSDLSTQSLRLQAAGGDESVAS